MASKPWGQVFQVVLEELGKGETVEHFFTVTLPGRPRGKFKYLTKAPGKEQIGARLLFQHEAKIVATAILLGKFDIPNSTDGFNGYLELAAIRWLGDAPITDTEFSAHASGRVLRQPTYLLRDTDSDREWFLTRMGIVP